MSDTIHRQLPYRGPLSSKVVNEANADFRDELDSQRAKIEKIDGEVSKIGREKALANQSGAAHSQYARKEAELAHETIGIKGTDETQTQVFTFFDSKDVFYEVDDGVGNLEGYATSRRCRINTRFGQVTPPFNGIKSMFWSPAVGDAESVILPEAAISLTEQSSQAADFFESTDSRNAFDASSNDPYLIRAVYPLDSDVAEAKFDVNIQVPQDIIRQANMISLETAPELRCSITGIKYSDSSIVANTDIPGLPEIGVNTPLNDTPPVRFFFDTIDIVSLRVQLSSKNFVIENGRKVFYLGFREIGLYLAEIDQTWTNNPGGFTNNGFLIKLQVPTLEGITPDSTYLDTIEDIKTSPELADGLSPSSGIIGTNTGVRVMVLEDDDLSSVDFDSVTDSFPHTVTGNKEHVWLAVELDRNNGTGIIPVLTSLACEYTLK